MRPFWATQAESYYPINIHPALKTAARDAYRMLASLAAYVVTLAGFVIIGIHAWNGFTADDGIETPAKSAWSQATRSYPAFAISKENLVDKTVSYTIFRHPEGGRKDVMQWRNPDQKPIAELELYRLGGEWSASDSATMDIALRMDLQRGLTDSQKSSREGRSELESGGIIDTKFGPVKLLGPVLSADHATSCLGFIKRFQDPNLQISGWSCQGDTWPAKRAAVSCLLDRLVLLTAGNEPKLSELFARAELKRSNCAGSAMPLSSGDWLTSMDNPRLRGRL